MYIKKNFKYIEVSEKEKVYSIWLNRPDKRNAFNSEMIGELLCCFEEVNMLPNDTIVIFRGRGNAFCAGADFNWMQEAFNLNDEANYEECKKLALLFFNLYTMNKITIAIAEGPAFGGGVGLLTACDLAYSTSDSKFSLSELRIGLVASTISPYVYKRLGEMRMKELIFTGEVIDAYKAKEYGLLCNVIEKDNVDGFISGLVENIQKGAPQARFLSKKLIHQIALDAIDFHDIDYTANLLADVRVGDEAKEGLAAFLEKRKAKW